MRRTIYDAEHEAFRDAVRQFTAKEVVPHFAEWERQHHVPRDLYRQMGQLGFLGMQIPEQYGGGGQTTYKFNAILSEEMARQYVVFGTATLHSDVVVPYIHGSATRSRSSAGCPAGLGRDRDGDRDDRARHGLGPRRRSRTTARARRRLLRHQRRQDVHLQRHLCDVCVVAAKTDPDPKNAHQGISPLRGRGGTRRASSRARSSRRWAWPRRTPSELFFEDCRVPAANRLGEEGEGFLHLMQKLQQERLVVAVGAQAAAEQVLERHHRVHAGAQGVRQADQQVPEHAVQAGRVRHARSRSAGRSSTGCSPSTWRGSTSRECSMAKLWQTEMQGRVVDTCLQFFGGYGYMLEYPVAAPSWTPACSASTRAPTRS